MMAKISCELFDLQINILILFNNYLHKIASVRLLA